MPVKRAPLRFIILTATGQDVRKCATCKYCQVDESLQSRFDLPVWQVLAAVRNDDEVALTNQTVRVLAGAYPAEVRCRRGLNLVAIAQTICQEARLRGLD